MVIKILGFLAITLLTIPSAAAQTHSRTQQDFLSRNNIATDFVGCQFNANASPLTVLIGDDFVVQPFRHNLNIFQISGTGSISSSDADNILEDATDLLVTDSGNDDISCKVEMRRSGGISNLAAPAGVVGGVVTTTADFNSLRAATGNNKGDVLVVEGLTVCGSMVGSFNGCASSNSSMVINISSAKDSTWPHEFGHVQGLDHRPATGSSCFFAPGDSNIMYPTGCSGRKKINAAECTAFFQDAQC